MSVDATKLVIPGNGTVFHAAKNTLPPASPLTAFSLAGTAPTGWTNLGHTSKQNTISFSKDGGDKTSLDTWIADAVRTVYSSVSWSVTIPALQIDADVLDLAFNGDFHSGQSGTGGYIVPGSPTPQEAALFIYFKDSTGAMGFWIPNASVSLGDAPSVDTANFFELPLSAAIQSADTSVIPAVDGKAGIMEIFKTGLSA